MPGPRTSSGGVYLFLAMGLPWVMLRFPDLRISGNTHLVLGATACIWAIGVIIRAYLRRSHLPPSPPTRRLRGHFLPPHNTSLTVARWIDEYGPLVTIRSGLQAIVIIGRYKAAVDIMEKQGKLVAGRPRLAAGEILERGLSIVLSHAGDRFRRFRRALHSHLQPKSAEAYQPLQMSQAKTMILNILHDPDRFQDHAGTYAAATIMKVAYGKTTPTSATDPEIREARQLIRDFRKILHRGRYLVDLMPWLKYVPGYAPELKDQSERTRRLYTDLLNRVKLQMQSNADIGPSFTKHILENGHLYGLTEIEMAYLAGALFGAGTETTAVAICTVLMAAAHFPEEQAKVQDELDAVIGRKRGNSGFSHRNSDNYCIPAGTTVIGNHWAISRDPEVYPEPNAFKPQRWIDDQGRLRDDLSFFVFGFGRRVCPGLHVANRSVFINSVLILWAFQLSLDPTKPKDDMGFMNATMPNVPLAIEFKTRVPEVELRRMMKDYPEAG
ncbi:hypothetical protein CY34DRAFT_10983 [Suillus luteus UH-Slu-Lm8-n1]|uniref:Cytochrome P450 n=1 Tax=Suillus luteus UH-Slu-Lm8-n1 TaxID=930992 RepID=A0A0D0ASB0_9AGAM|nr:hypothetical protein CY34DRAFT_10983 [Suillus luteus UH-Slu-Lm8-n1]